MCVCVCVCVFVCVCVCVCVFSIKREWSEPVSMWRSTVLIFPFSKNSLVLVSLQILLKKYRFLVLLVDLGGTKRRTKRLCKCCLREGKKLRLFFIFLSSQPDINKCLVIRVQVYSWHDKDAMTLNIMTLAKYRDTWYNYTLHNSKQQNGIS